MIISNIKKRGPEETHRWVGVWKRIAFTAGVVLLLSAAAALSQETIVLRAWTIGPEDASITRSTNLEAAAERLNAALEEENEPYRVRVEAAFESDSWVAHRRRIPPLSSRPG